MDKKVKELNRAVEKVTSYEKSQGKVLPEYLSADESAKLYNDSLKAERKDYRKAKHQLRENELVEYNTMLANKKLKKERKVARHRPLKNFGWWFVGFLSFIVIFVGSICATLFLIPVNKIGGDSTTDYVSEDIANASLLNAIMNLTSYTVDDVPALKLLIDTLNEELSLDDYVVLDLDAMKDTKVLSQDMLDGLSSNLKVVATLSSVGMSNMLNMSAFSDFVEVAENDMPDETGTDFNTYLYYYKVDDTTYARAFDNEHNRLAEAKGKTLYYPALNDVVLTELGEVFADRLNYEKMTSLLAVFGMESGTIVDIVGDRTVGEMASFDINEVKMSVVFDVDDSNAKLRDSLVDMTRSSVIDDLACAKYLEANENKTKDDWEALTDAEKETYLTMAEQSYPTIDNYAFEEYVKADNTKTRADWIALADADKEQYITLAETNHSDIGQEQYDLICIGDLSKADMDSIKLTTVMSADSNAKMFAILCDMTGKANDELTVGDLSSANVDQIKITSVMEETDSNKKLFNILEDMTRNNVLDDMACEKYLEANENKTEEDWKALSDSDKSSYITLAKTDYNALDKNAKHNLIRVTHMGNGDVTHIKLTSILDDDEENKKLYAVLQDLTYDNVLEQYIFDNYGVTEDQWKGKDDSAVIGTTGKTKAELKAEADTAYNAVDNENYYIYINDTYSITKAEFDALSDNDIVGETGKTKAQIYEEAKNYYRHSLITVASLDGGNISAIKLSNVMSSSDNVIFNALLEKDPNVTVGTMSETINNLTIAEVYGDKVFTDDEAKACTYGDEMQVKYIKSTNAEGKAVYTMVSYTDTSAEKYYYVSTEASIWLFMLYDCSGTNAPAVESTSTDANGNGVGFGVTYTESGLTLSGISGSISNIKSAISGATVRRLVAAGILSSSTNYDPLNTGRYNKTLNDLLTVVA